MSLDRELYVTRISQATPVQLTIINYEITIDYLTDAISANDLNDREELIAYAVEALHQLTLSLNFDYSISNQLFNLYVYANKLINQSNLTTDNSKLIEAKELLSGLLDSWVEIEKNDTNNSSVMENSEKVFAGLTYSKGGLSEYIPDDGRGYDA